MSGLHENDKLCIIDYETTGVDTENDMPIEVAFVITDLSLNVEDEYETCILWPEVELLASHTRLPAGSPKSEVGGGWKDGAAIAHNYHGIDFDELEEFGQPAGVVAWVMSQMIKLHMAELNEDAEEGVTNKIILISDNIQFEWAFTKRLLGINPSYTPWPFHYCGWDTSILELVGGLGFKDPADPEHRAMGDVMGLLAELKKAGLQFNG